MKWLKDISHKFFNENKGVRRLFLLWACCLTTWISIQVFGNVEVLKVLNENVRLVMLGVFAFVTLSATFYFKGRKEDKDDSN